MFIHLFTVKMCLRGESHLFRVSSCCIPSLACVKLGGKYAICVQCGVGLHACRIPRMRRTGVTTYLLLYACGRALLHEQSALEALRATVGL